MVILHLISGFATKALSLFPFGCFLAIVQIPSEIQNDRRVLIMEGSSVRAEKSGERHAYTGQSATDNPR
jgi:hypothetical protein